MVLSLVLVDFMDRVSGVHNGRLNSLLLDHGLDVLVYVVMDMLSCYCWSGGRGVLSFADCAGVLELCFLGGQTFIDVVIVSMLDVSVLHIMYLVAVLFWKNFTMLDGLDGGVMMVLMDFTIYGGGGILMLSTGDTLVLNSGVDSLEKWLEGVEGRLSKEVPREQ